MPSPRPDLHSPVVTGIGVASGLGHGKDAFRAGLFEGRSVFAPLARPGRQRDDDSPPFFGVEMPDPPSILPPRVERTAGLSGRAAVAVLDEAWREAGLDRVAPERIGLIVGGTNLMAREQLLSLRDYADRLDFLPPRHGHVFLDTDICGLCASQFPIRGFAHTVGAASASGAVAIVAAVEAVRSGRVDACIALGALQDVSMTDLQGFRALGALDAGPVCRPMDTGHDGFLYGEACAALVVTRPEHAGGTVYGRVLGTGFCTDGSRGPEPNSDAQVRAAQDALAAAGLVAADIDYVNGHATGTPSGDAAEIETLRRLGLAHARVNATKSIIGHGLSAAGAVEAAAVLIQMREGALHPTLNLDTPLDEGFGWVRGAAQEHRICHALKFSFGFGGTNVALVFGAPEGEAA